MSWRITGDRETGLAIEDEKGELVCEQVRQHERLLVAAPELLAALRGSQASVCAEYCSGSHHVYSCRKAQEAIDKAEGRQ